MDKTAVRIIDVFDTVDEFVFSLVFLTLPFGWQFSIIPFLLFAVLMLRKALNDRVKPSRERFFYFLPVFAYFGVIAISLLYSSNPGRGFDLFFRKIAMLIVPLLLIFTSFSPALARKGLRFFVLGTLLATILFFVMAFANSLKIGDGMLCIIPGFNGSEAGILDTDMRNNYFLAENFTFLMHPSYFGVLLALSTILVVFTLVYEPESLLIKRIAFPVFLLCGGAMLLLSTNASMITAVFIALTLIVLAWRYKSWLDLKSYWLILLAILLLIGAAYHPQTLSITSDLKSSQSFEMRSHATQAVKTVITNNPVFGVGTGDLDKEMGVVYGSLGLDDFKANRIDPHNQFLHTMAETGIAGLITLLWMLGTLLFFGFKRRSFVMLTFALVFIVNMLFESMLSRYWGIIFFALFYTLLFFHSEPKNESN